jgi:hypothetical protein
MATAHPYRLSDAERDEAISALADAYADGRLTAEEFDQRMAVASTARFATDLDGLFSDLPPRPAVRATVPAPSRRPARRSRFPLLLVPVIAAVALLALLGAPWFLLPMLFLWFSWGRPGHWQQGRQPGHVRRCSRW